MLVSTRRVARPANLPHAVSAEHATIYRAWRVLADKGRTRGRSEAHSFESVHLPFDRAVAPPCVTAASTANTSRRNRATKHSINAMPLPSARSSQRRWLSQDRAERQHQ
jgi:hypothetical protein